MKKAIYGALAVCMVVFIVALGGCRDISGGGWIPSATLVETDKSPKATFAFNFICEDTSSKGPDSATGQMTYHDHGILAQNWPGVITKSKGPLAVQAVIQRPDGDDAPNWCLPDAYYGSYFGTYTPIPATLGKGGAIFVIASDGGGTGQEKNDYLSSPSWAVFFTAIQTLASCGVATLRGETTLFKFIANNR